MNPCPIQEHGSYCDGNHTWMWPYVIICGLLALAFAAIIAAEIVVML